MQNQRSRGSVPPFIRRLMPDAPEPELEEAIENVKRYLSVMSRIAERLEVGGQLEEVIERQWNEEERAMRQELLGDLIFILAYRAAMKSRWRHTDGNRRRNG